MTTSCSRADWRCGEAEKSYISAVTVIDFFAIISAEDENCHGETLDLTGLAEGAMYDIAEINCTVPHDAKLDGRRLGLALHGPYDSAVFEISQGD